MNIIDAYLYTMKCERHKFEQPGSYNIGDHLNIDLDQLLDSLKNKLQIAFPKDRVDIFHQASIENVSSDQNDQGESSSLVVLMEQIFFNTYQFILQVQMQKEIDEIFIRGTFIKNGLPIVIYSKEKRLMAIRRINNINKELRPIKVMINPFSGQITLENCSFINPDYLGKIKYKNIPSATNKIFYIIQTLLKYKLILLYILQENPQRKEYCRQHLSFFQFAIKDKKSLHQIQNRLDQFCLKTFDQQFCLDDELRMQQVKRETLFFNEDIEKCLQQLKVNAYGHNNRINKLLTDEYPAKNLKQMTPQTDLKKKLYIYNQIIIQNYQNELQWKQIFKGGFGIIQQANVICYLIDNQESKTQRYIKTTEEDRFCQKMVRKSDRQDKGKQIKQKVEKEIQLLRSLHHKSHPNVLTFFQNVAEIEENKHYLYSLYQENLSLTLFLENHKIFSFLQKLFMLEQSAKGLLFLHRQNIAHIDFKPDNILVGRNYVIKIADFGQSELIPDLNKRQKFAYTFPYAPPQIYQQQKQIRTFTSLQKRKQKVQEIVEPYKKELTEAVDVYELGVTIYKCIFGHHIWGNRLNKKQMIERMKTDRILAPLLMPEMLVNFADRKVIYLLVYLCLRCVQSDPRKRPSMPWIITALYECRTYLESLSFE